MIIVLILWMIFMGAGFWRSYIKVQNEFFSEESDRRVVLKQIVAFAIFTESTLLFVITFLSQLPTVSYLLICIMFLMLIYVGISSIVNKVNFRKSAFIDRPRDDWAVIVGCIFIIVAVVMLVAYSRYQYVLVFGDGR